MSPSPPAPRGSHCFHTFVLAIYPALIVLSTNAGVLPMNAWAVGRTLTISVALVACLLLLLKPVLPALRDRALWTSCVLIGFNLYPALSPSGAGPTYAAAFALASVAAATLIMRFARLREHSAGPLNLAAVALLLMNLYDVVPAIAAPEAWRDTANTLIESVDARAGTFRNGRPPDIYYIVLDGFGRPDVLADVYGLDLGPFVKRLESEGFVVPASSRSNYGQTYLSLASSLNLNYLDPIASRLTGSRDRRPLDYLIQHNALFALAKRAGYRVIGIGSNYSATEQLASADVCLCERYGMSELETAVLDRTPLGALPIDRLTYGAHRRKIERQFLHLAAEPDAGAPRLVFAHIIAPHPPFVFDAHGNAQNPPVIFGFEDANHFKGSGAEYVSGYRGQAQFVASRFLALIETILKRPGPSPLIVVHGDHGPALKWNWNSVGTGDARERLAIFAAYRLPDLAAAPVRADISPVNLVRLVANRAFGATLPLLEDRSFESTWERPYTLALVDSERLVKPSRETQR